jgi:hypothetical protein
MNDNIERHPSFETAAVLLRTKELIRTVCERISFPCWSYEDKKSNFGK